MTTAPPGRLPAIRLRSPRESDADVFLRAARASRELHDPWYRPPGTTAEWVEYVRRCATESHRGYLILDPEDGGLAGIATVANIIRGSFWSAPLGYAAMSPSEGRGLMSAGIAAVLDDVFERIRLHRIEANVQPGNAPSRALVERLGFRLEGFSPGYLAIAGEWRDHDRWAILADEWRARRRELGP
jgi:ribosomal-protein-alanine N-acetyltransferase